MDQETLHLNPTVYTGMDLCQVFYKGYHESSAA